MKHDLTARTGSQHKEVFIFCQRTFFVFKFYCRHIFGSFAFAGFSQANTVAKPKEPNFPTPYSFIS